MRTKPEESDINMKHSTKELILSNFFKKEISRMLIVSLLAIYRGIDGE